MIDLGTLINSKEFKDHYKKSSPEQKKIIDDFIEFAKLKLKEYEDAIVEELRSRT